MKYAQFMIMAIAVAAGMPALADPSSRGADPVTNMLRRIDSSKVTPVTLKNTVECKVAIEKLRTEKVFSAGIDGALLGTTVVGAISMINLFQEFSAEKLRLEAFDQATAAVARSGKVPDPLILQDLKQLYTLAHSSDEMVRMIQLAQKYNDSPQAAKLLSEMRIIATDKFFTESNFAKYLGLNDLSGVKLSQSEAAELLSKLDIPALMKRFNSLQKDFAERIALQNSTEALKRMTTNSSELALRLKNLRSLLRPSVVEVTGNFSKKLFMGAFGGAILQAFLSSASTDSCDTITCQFQTDRILFSPKYPAQLLCDAAFRPGVESENLKATIEFKASLITKVAAQNTVIPPNERSEHPAVR